MNVSQFPWYVKVFAALGGAGLIWKMVGSNARSLVHSLLGWAIHKLPGFAEFVIANKDRIIPILKDSEAGAEDAINEVVISAPPPAAPPAA